MLKDFIDRYLDKLRFEKRASQHTIESYQRVLTKALEVLEREFSDLKEWKDVKLEQMRVIQRES